jgi:hypothetical protein
MSVLVIIAAAFFTVIAVRKLPGVRTLVERGVKPWACDVCMAFWATMAWSLWDAWLCYEWLLGVVATAAVVYVVVTAHGVVMSRLGWRDGSEKMKAADYKEPES